jgi:hypothetical protein
MIRPSRQGRAYMPMPNVKRLTSCVSTEVRKTIANELFIETTRAKATDFRVSDRMSLVRGATSETSSFTFVRRSKLAVARVCRLTKVLTQCRRRSRSAFSSAAT